MVAIVKANRFQPACQGAFTTVVLHLAVSSFIRGNDNDINLIHKLFAAFAVGVVVVVDGLEERIALLIEIAARNYLVPPDKGFRYLEVFGVCLQRCHLIRVFCLSCRTQEDIKKA